VKSQSQESIVSLIGVEFEKNQSESAKLDDRLEWLPWTAWLTCWRFKKRNASMQTVRNRLESELEIWTQRILGFTKLSPFVKLADPRISILSHIHKPIWILRIYEFKNWSSSAKSILQSRRSILTSLDIFRVFFHRARVHVSSRLIGGKYPSISAFRAFNGDNEYRSRCSATNSVTRKYLLDNIGRRPDGNRRGHCSRWQMSTYGIVVNDCSRYG